MTKNKLASVGWRGRFHCPTVLQATERKLAPEKSSKEKKVPKESSKTKVYSIVEKLPLVE